MSRYGEHRLKSGRDFRIIHLYPGTAVDDIHCSLHVFSLADPPSYEALSYVWGPMTKNNQVTICKIGVLSVTDNLYAALLRLRHAKEPRRIWIDSLCINQDDLRERAAQVQLMRDIYARASEVLVWLGEEDEGTLMAFNLVEKIAKATDHRFDLTPEGGWIPEQFESAGLPMEDEPWLHLVNLLDRPWFLRSWVIQEVAASAVARVFCGSYSLPWEMLSACAKVIASTNLYSSFEGQIEVLGCIDYVVAAFRRGPLDLWLLLTMGWTRYASDPRDKVFAYLGMAREHHAMLIPVDYAASVERVYIQATRVLIQKRKDLAVLSAVQEKNDEHDLPSWVVDWSTGPYRGYLVSGQLQWGLDGMTPHWSLYEASSSSRIRLGYSNCFRTLILGGMHYARITTIGEVQQDYDDYDVLPPSYKQWLGCINSFLDSPYPGTTETYFQAFSVTMIRDVDSWPTREIRASSELRYALLAIHSRDKEGTGKASPPGNSDKNSTPIHLRYTTNAAVFGKIRRFFVTDNGRIGLAPKEAELGDEVCILFGGYVPYIVRRREGFHQFIGESYVHGIINGEAMQQHSAAKSVQYIFR